jgi:hypothetical protein
VDGFSQSRAGAGIDHPPRASASSSGALTLDLLRLRLRLSALPFNLDPTRPQNLGYLSYELDGEQTVHQTGAGDFHMIRELKAPLERACSDAAVQEFSFRTGRPGVTTLTLNEQQVPLGGDRYLVLLEPGDRKGDAESVLTSALDVVRRVLVGFLLAARRALQKVEDPVEADRGAKQRAEVIGLWHHPYPPSRSNMDWRGTDTLAPAAGSSGASGSKSFGPKKWSFKMGQRFFRALPL